MIQSAKITDQSPEAVTLEVIDGSGRTLSVVVTIAEGEETRGDRAYVVFLDTEEWEPTPDQLRVNVNDGPVFNYPTGTNHYGEDQGVAAPDADV